ncbi:hypothetical protein EsDP_00004339 [Epichloe bromicola]|uniref:Dihydrolipoyl dehydrogenase n=1 Tax=Epichloe bromicola TaxID=79588 RepID=A0ABQ0CRE9_9HYPO
MPTVHNTLDEDLSGSSSKLFASLNSSAQGLDPEDAGTELALKGGTDESEASHSVYETKHQPQRQTENGSMPKTLLKQLAQDDAEIEDLERKLGIRKGRRSLPQAFKDDGLDELLGGVVDGDSTSEDDQGKRKAAYDSWLSSKRRKPNALPEFSTERDLGNMLIGSDCESSQHDSFNHPEMRLDNFEPKRKLCNAPDGFERKYDDDLTRKSDGSFESFDDTSEVLTILQSPPRPRENPYVAPTGGTNLAKYIPPSKRHQEEGKEDTKLQKRLQGVVNRLTDACLISLTQSVEGIYQSHARGEVTETLTDAILAQMRKSETLPDQFFVLIGGFSAAIYKITGSSFGSHLVRRVVGEFSEQYNYALTYTGNHIRKEPSNLLTFLTQLYVFEVVGCTIVFDYMERLLDNLSELNVELLLRVCRMAGRLLRRDDPQALQHVSNVLNVAVSRIGYSNISVRTKFMVETIQDLKNSKAKAKGTESIIVYEHVLRMKKRLGELKTQSRRLDGLTPMGIRLKDIEDVDRHGKWWLVGASVPEYRDATERASLVSGQAKTTLNEAPDDEDMDFVLPDFPNKAKAQGLNTPSQIAIFTAIMSALDSEHGYRQFANLRLKRDEQLEITRVLVQCVGSELHYNEYYALVGRQACTNGRVRFAFQNRLWGMFRGLGESLFGGEEDDEETMEGERMKNDRRLRHVAQFYASLVADGSLSITILKPVELPKLNSWSSIFVEWFILSLLRKCKGKRSHGDEKVEQEKDLVIIGGGVAGYVAAIKAGQEGMKVACIEKRGTLGGTCLNVGCIPSKSLLNNSHLYHQILHDTKNRGIEVGEVKLNLPNFMKAKDSAVNGLTKGVEFLLKKNGVDYIKGAASFVNENDIKVALNEGGETTVRGKNILIATGSEATPFPGLKIDEKRVITSTGAIALEKIPETMIVIGGGIIGLEMASVWSRLGTKVTVVEFLGQIGGPGMDAEIAKATHKLFKKQGMEFKLNTKVISGDSSGDKVSLNVDAAKGGKSETLDADVVLVAIGRRPYTQGLGLENIDMELDERGRVIIDSEYRTKIPHIRCVGDVTFGPMLAHKAEEEAVAVVEYIKKGYGHVNYGCIPSVMYTYPEVAWVGQNEQDLKNQKIPYRVGTFPFSANSRAKTNLDTDGLVKMLADPETDRLLGVHIIGPNAGEMIAEGTLALEYGASTEDIARTCHAHPTLSEAFKEAAMATSSKAIHF